MEKIKLLKNSIKIVEKTLDNSLKDIFGIDGRVNVKIYDKTNEYDYQSAYALMHFKNIKKKSKLEQKFMSPKELSGFLKEQIGEKYKNLFKKVEIRNNFLLLELKDSYLMEEVDKIISSPIKVESTQKSKEIVVDFSSPNIAKEMHVGHLRSTIMGESICRIFEFLGNKVKRVNHVGDWGTQFGMLIMYLIENYPDYLQKTPNLKDLETFYKQSKQKFDEDPEFKQRAQLKVVDLQKGDEKARKAWQILCEISRQFFTKIYERLDVTNKEYGESFYNEMIPSVIDELKEKNLVKMDEGALCMFLPKIKVPLMLIKSDGGYNYDTTDMAAARFRLTEWKADRVVILTDVGQWPHFKKIFKGSEMAGWHVPKKTSMEHMGFGVILGEDGKRMKTRKGKSFKLMDLLDEAREKAKQKIIDRLKEHEGETKNKAKFNEEEIEKAAEILGIASIKYFDLRQNRIQDYKFIMEDMLSQKGDTAVYLMYSYIRLCSILRNSKFSEEELLKEPFEFTHEYERVLARHLVKFTETIEYVSDKLAINFLCKYLFDLATKVAAGYKKYRINDTAESKNRTKLILAVKKVMERCFFLLGMKTIDRI